MKYQLINYRPKHDEMIKMIGRKLWSIIDDEITQIKVIGVTVDRESKKWVWVFYNEKKWIKENQPIFKNKWSAEQYEKRNKRVHQ